MSLSKPERALPAAKGEMRFPPGSQKVLPVTCTPRAGRSANAEGCMERKGDRDTGTQ